VWGGLRRALAGVARRLSGTDAEERARTSEERLALALEASGMAIWELDADSGQVWWSEQAGRLFGGAGPAGPLSRLPHVLQQIHPDDRPAFQAAVAEAIARPGELRSVQARVVWPDGSVRWLEVRGCASLDDARRLSRLRGSLVDVTEGKRVEEDLRRNLAEMRVLAAVAEAVAAAPDEDTLLARVTALAQDAFFPDNCGFLLHDPAANALCHARSYHSRRGEGSLSPIPVGRGVVGSVFATGCPQRVDDVRLEPHYLPLDPGMLSEICVPLEVGSRVIGVFDAESTRPGAFTVEDERLLGVVASQVAGALERLRASAARRDSEKMYRAYFTESPVALFVSDTKGRYLEVNGAACSLTGRSRDELVGRSIADVLDPREGAPLGERLVGLLALGSGGNEIRVRRKDGSLRHCLVHASSIGADRLLGMLLDITDRREAEERLRESEDRFRSLSEASLEAIFVHDGGRVVDVNQALCDMSGYAWHEIVGRDGFELIAPECREQVYRNLLAEHDKPYEIECVRRDGGRVPVEVHARSFPYRGRVLRVVAVRDISGRREAAAERDSLVGALEQKNTELERFGDMVTHDLKGPFVTIRGLADHLERDLRMGRHDRAGADARRIVEAVGRVQRMLDELLEVSRAGRPVGPPAAVSADELVKEAVRLVGGRLEAAGLRLDVASPLPVVYGDRPRLVHIFRDLLDNAARFRSGAGGGRVLVEAGPPEEGRATLVIRDDGAGVDPRHRGRVFDLFERLDPGGSGEGAGLAVVRRIVESHGGRIRVEPGAGEGTTVWLALPLPPSARRGATPTEEVSRPRG
jgi:PAS domain S-box-containing protein